MTPQFQLLPLHRVLEDSGQPRDQFEAEAMQELLETVRTHGILQPLQVRPLGNDYVVIEGGRRRKAAAELGLDEVPCLIYSELANDLERVRAMQLISNTGRSPLTPLEDAQALWLYWLIKQTHAVNAELGRENDILSDLLQDGDPILQQIRVLEDHIVVSLGVDAIQEYIGGGRVRVSWADVLSSAGRGDWNQAKRIRHLAPLKLSRAVQAQLVGDDITANTLSQLAQHSPEDQQVLLDQARQGSGPMGSALRDAMKHRKGDDSADDDDDMLDPDAPEGKRKGKGKGKGDDFEPDPQMALLTKGNNAPSLRTDGPAPARGSTPPNGHDLWDNNTALQVSGALEALLAVLHPAQGQRMREDQYASINVLWQEVQQLMQQAQSEE